MRIVRLFAAMLVATLFFVQGCAEKDKEVWVTTEKVRAGAPVSTDFITGKVEALDSASIVPKVGGRVSQVMVDVGSRVKAGQALLKIDLPDLEATRDQYRAAVDDAEAAVKKSRVDLEVARENYDRALSLYKSGALAKSDLDNKYATPYDLARIQAEETAPHKLAQARAALQSVEANYANNLITSPIDGEVTARQINPGEMCSTGKPVFYVADLTRTVVLAYVDDRKINSFKVGQRVEIKLDSLDRLLEAEVKNISYTLDPASKGYQVKFQLTGNDPAVKPGMFARVYTAGGAGRQLVVPKSAMINEGGSYSVFVYNEGKVARVPVQVEKISERFVVLGGGLNQGQELVVYSSGALQDGMSVRVR